MQIIIIIQLINLDIRLELDQDLDLEIELTQHLDQPLSLLWLIILNIMIYYHPAITVPHLFINGCGIIQNMA